MPTFPTTYEVAPAAAGKDSVLVKILGRLLFPLARLCLANGVTFAAVEELLKHAFVREANALEPGAPVHGTVSRISTATGLTRREVTRLCSADAPARSTKPPVASEVFARWTTDSRYRDADGAPCLLKRQGGESSFETLAQSVTRDVHPRSMLDELVRLGIVLHDKEHDCVSLVGKEFVPSGDSRQMLDLLGDNVGDHLDAAVSNVLGDVGRHHEQAIFADELSSESIKELHHLIAEQWKSLRDAMVPKITELIESDRLAGRIQDQRLRIGLYSFDESSANTETPAGKAGSHPNKE